MASFVVSKLAVAVVMLQLIYSAWLVKDLRIDDRLIATWRMKHVVNVTVGAYFVGSVFDHDHLHKVYSW